MSDDIPYLHDAVMDIISAIDRFIGSRDPSIDFQPIVFKLDFLQRITVNLDVDDVVTELRLDLRWIKETMLTVHIKPH